MIPGRRTWRGLIVPAVTYPIPIVQVALTVSRIVLGIDPAGWHQFPGVTPLGTPRQLLVTAVLLVLLFSATLAVV